MSDNYSSTSFPYFVGPTGADQGVRILDINGDSLPDMVQSWDLEPTDTKAVYINNGNGTGWTVDTNYVSGSYPTFADSGGNDQGVLIGDVNGDGLPDLIQSWDLVGSSNDFKRVFLNKGDGTGWAEDSNYASTSYPFFMDTDGIDRGVRIADVNGDGMADMIQGREPSNKGIFINNGDGTGWTPANTYVLSSFPFFVNVNGLDQGVRILDINGDSLPDMVKSVDDVPRTFYINDGDGTGWTEDGTYSMALDFIDASGDAGVRNADINGDGMEDMFQSDDSDPDQKFVHPKNGEKADLLARVTSSTGAQTNITYKGSAEFRDGSDNLLNPRLPLNLDLVDAIGVNDGFGTISTTTYTYGGGYYNFNNSFDREFALFATTTRTDPLGFVTKTFYHQGDATNTAIGEFQDHISKRGKPYRVEVYDASNNLYKKIINKWENTALDYGRKLVNLTRSTDMMYDGDADHKDKSETYLYATSTGNLTYKQEWGEVSASDYGSFTDTGSDKFGTTYTYAASTSPATFLSQETVVNSASTTVRDTKFYYDSLAQGSATKGNETKREFWKSGASWIDTEKTYNTYGLVTQDKDPRDKATTYTFDSFNLFVATSTNPLSHTTGFQYDYSSGRVATTTDANSRVFATVYDPLDRAKEIKQPDLITPTTLVTKTALTYTDTIGNRSVQETNYLNSATSTDRYTYLDGIDRIKQERTEAEDANTFSVKDFQYNLAGMLQRESLPYFSTGTASTSPATTATLFATTVYDPLYRVTGVGTAVGSTTNAYDQWRQSITDANSNVKHLTRDAYGNLSQVEEVNDASTYTTTYEYNYLKNLTKITDAPNRVRTLFTSVRN